MAQQCLGTFELHSWRWKICLQDLIYSEHKTVREASLWNTIRKRTILQVPQVSLELLHYAAELQVIVLWTS